VVVVVVVEVAVVVVVGSYGSKLAYESKDRQILSKLPVCRCL
jgi:hypothetical protein